MDANELQKINDFLKGDSIARADMLAQRYNKSGDVLIRIPSAQVDKIWQKVYTAFNNKKIGQRIKISPVGDDQNHRLYVFAPDCYDNTNEMHKIISALKELGLDPVEYQPTSYFDLGLRFTKKISELKPSKK